MFRMYLGFGFAYTEGGQWSDEGIKAIARFVGRLERLVETAAAMDKNIEANTAARRRNWISSGTPR